MRYKNLKAQWGIGFDLDKVSFKGVFIGHGEA